MMPKAYSCYLKVLKLKVLKLICIVWSHKVGRHMIYPLQQDFGVANKWSVSRSSKVLG